MKLPNAGGRHWNFYLALLSGIIVLLVMVLPLRELAAVLAASVFSLTYLVLSFKDMPKLTPDYLRRHAADEGAPPTIVFVLTLGIVAYVTIALFMVINAGSNADVLRLLLGLASVVLSWLMITTMWAMHYAWEYYEAPDEAHQDAKQRGGLDFPGDELPDGMAFVYFSLVVAMTAQTSDTDVTDNKMRRIVSAQSLFSYLFNTVAVAAAVNIVVSLAS